MTIALRVELKEDWGSNCPAVRVMAKTFGRHPSEDREIARLTPTNPVADVCITKEQDVYFEVNGYSLDVLEGREVMPRVEQPPENERSQSGHGKGVI